MVSGVCIGVVPPKVNALGVVVLIVCVSIAVAVRTSNAIYLISIVQTLGLLSFVQIAWVVPVGYLLQGLQYFMIFNWIGAGYKLSDQSMRQRQYYRLDLYLRESNLLKNIALVGLVSLALFFIIVGLAIYKYRK